MKILIWVPLKDVENKVINKFSYSNPESIDEIWVQVEVSHDQFIRLIDEKKIS
tara:strand:- start:436 stop:594 length:159 start_codon:yes stop_codon:yes gene_type:complete